MLFEATQRLNEAAVAQCGEADNSHVDTNGAGGRWNGLFDVALSLDAGEPLAARLTDGDVFGCAENVTAVAIPHPTQFGDLDAAVALIDLKALWKLETVTTSALFETRKICTFFKEVFESPLQVFQRLLQSLRRRLLEPGKLFFPLRKAIGHIDIADEFAACCIVGLLNLYGLIPRPLGRYSDA